MRWLWPASKLWMVLVAYGRPVVGANALAGGFMQCTRTRQQFMSDCAFAWPLVSTQWLSLVSCATTCACLLQVDHSQWCWMLSWWLWIA